MSLIALAVFAIAPAMASAAPTLKEGGTTLATGTNVVGTLNTGTNAILTARNSSGTDVGTVTCTASTLTGSVHTNNTTNGIEVTLETVSYTGAEAGGKCASTIPFSGPIAVDVENLHYCLKSSVFGSGTVQGSACTAAPARNKFTLTGSINCTYESEAAGGISGTYAAEDGTEATLIKSTNQKFNFVAGSGLCPAKGEFTATYRLETDGNTNSVTIANT
ncbi:MAG TPA: hypothetical protein VF009_07830 [Solirubrobacterales bacterium]